MTKIIMKNHPKISLLDLYKIFLSVIFVLDIYLLIKVKIISIQCSEKLFEIFPLLVGSSSIIVSILIGYLFTRFSELKTFAKERFNRFVLLQKELNKYQEAFYWFSEAISQKFKIERQIPKSYDSLLKNIDFWEDDKQKPSSTLFARDFYEVGKDYIDFQDYELQINIIPENRIDQIWNIVSNIGGTLGRYKHYRHVLEELGLNPDAKFESIKIVDDILGVRIHAEKLKPYPILAWDSLAFWEEQVNNAIDIVERMKANPIKIHPVVVSSFKLIFILLVCVLVFGTIIPIIISSLQFPKVFSYLLSYLSIIGFIPTLITVLILIYREIKMQIDY